MPATGFPIVLVAPAHERELPLAFAAKGKRCKYSIASPCWIRDPIGSDRDVDDAPSLFLRLRLTFETRLACTPSRGVTSRPRNCFRSRTFLAMFRGTWLKIYLAFGWQPSICYLMCCGNSNGWCRGSRRNCDSNGGGDLESLVTTLSVICGWRR